MPQHQQADRERKLEKKAADKNKAVEEKAAAIKAAAQAAAEAEILRAADATAAAAGLCTVSPISASFVCSQLNESEMSESMRLRHAASSF